MRRPYRVLSGFRVGAGQKWLMPKETVQLLPCEAQYPLSRGWLADESNGKSTVKKSTQSVQKATDDNAETS